MMDFKLIDFSKLKNICRDLLHVLVSNIGNNNTKYVIKAKHSRITINGKNIEKLEIDLDSKTEEILRYFQSGGIGTAMINSLGGIMEVTIFGFHGNQGNIVLSRDSDLEKFYNLISLSLIQKNSNGKYEISEKGKLFFEQKHA